MRRVQIEILAAAGCLLLATACVRSRPPAEPVPASPPRQEIPPPAAPGPLETELKGALAAMDAGRLDEAKTRLEKLAALPSPSEQRESARYSLAILLARPGSPGRDVSRARALLEEVLADYPGAPREMGARLILSLLDVEDSCRSQLEELRAQVAASGSESDDLKAALAQREAELRRIKEILLGRTGGG